MTIIQFICVLVLTYTLVHDFVENDFQIWDATKLIAFAILLKEISFPS